MHIVYATMDICRLCLHSSSENLVTVLSETSLIESVKQFTSIEISENEDLPTRVCNFCIKKIQDWVTFRDNCIKSNKILIDLRQQKYENEKFEQNEIGQEMFNTSVELLDPSSHNKDLNFDVSEELVQDDKPKKKPCLECGREVIQLKEHMRRHNKRFKCSQCPKSYSAKFKLEEHINITHFDIKNHICEICGRKFGNATLLKTHILIHNNERLYKCDQCDYKGNTSGALNTHKYTHLNENCICAICSKSFNCKRRLGDHIKRVHVTEKTHECKFCGQKYAHNYILNVHVKRRHHTLL